MNEQGKYIVLEGPEAVGKTTQINRLIGSLAAEGVNARNDIREPGGNPMAEEIRDVVKNKDLERSPLTNLYLFNAGRAETLLVIKAALERGEWVVSDRNHTSTLVYQVHGEGLDHEVFATVTKPVADLCKPEFMLILMVSEEEQMDRQNARGVSDYFKNMPEDFHRRIRSGYINAARFADTYLIDGEGEESEVHERIWDWVVPLINGERPPQALIEESEITQKKYEQELQ